MDVDPRFTGPETLYAGEFRGLRAFRVNNCGELLGPVYPQTFRAGINHAQCHCSNVHSAHEIARPHTRCGFYSYHTGIHEFVGMKRLNAVVRVSGAVTVGTRGFRSSEVEVLAVSPHTMKDSLRQIVFALRQDLGWKHRRGSERRWHIVAALLLTLFIFSATLFIGVKLYNWQMLPPALGGLGTAAFTNWGKRRIFAHRMLQRLHHAQPNLPQCKNTRILTETYPLTKLEALNG